jgi:Fe-S cluster biogenesis protein NfuA
MNRKSFRLIALAALLALTNGVASASGSDGGGSAETGDAAAYNTGKAVYAAKLNCSGCPMSGKSLDAGMARDLLSNKKGVTLSAEESQALDVYLKRRFKL